MAHAIKSNKFMYMLLDLLENIFYDFGKKEKAVLNFVTKSHVLNIMCR